MKWIAFRRQGKLPPERRSVLVQVAERPALFGGHGRLPPTVAVGYLRVHSDGPFWVVPGVGGPVTHWCDCLGDDFHAPMIRVDQVKGRPRRQWWRD